MKTPLFAIVALAIASSLHAQPVAFDRLAPAWSLEHQRAAEVLSNVSLWSTVGVDTWSAWQAPDRRAAFLRQGLRYGVVESAALITKLIVHRDRPCAPACGVDAPSRSFLSGHTALAFAAGAGGRRVIVTMPLAASTGYFRIAANRHWLTDVLAGAGVGLITRGALR